MADLSVSNAMGTSLILVDSQRPLSARYEEAAGIYPGFSKAMRLKHEYRQLHPEVSAVRSARVASLWEELQDDEQRL